MRNLSLVDDLDDIHTAVREEDYEFDAYNEYEDFEEEYGSYESYEHMSKKRGLKKMKW